MIKSEIRNPKSETNPKFQNFLILFCGLLTMVCGLFGCEQIDKESIDKIVQEDSSFRDVLVKKEELDSKINLFLNQLRELKAMTDANIRTIQENFNKQKSEMDSKISVLKKELEPERLKIRQDIEMTRNLIFTKRAMLKSLENTKRDLANLINQQKAVNVTDKDMAKWQERFADLNKQIEPLAGEVRELEKKARSLRIKLMVLRQ